MRNGDLYGKVIGWDELPRESVRPGVTRCSYATDQVMLVLNELEAGMQANPHVHEDFDQLAYILEGTADFYIGDSAHRMRAGSFLLVPAGSVHRIEPLSERVLNLDIFVPPRADLEHLVAYVTGAAGP